MSTLHSASHPWMRASSRKRPHDTNSDDDAPTQRYPRPPTSTPPPSGAHARKRFRASGLVGTLAKLSLYYGADDLDMAVEDGPHAPPATHSFAAPLPPAENEILRNGSVEEPVPEIRMHATSWYEPTPDRIIVTDLDGSDVDADDEREVGPVVLASALELLQKRVAAPVLPWSSDAGQKLALVPFRPPLFQAPPGLGFEDQAPAQRGIVVEEEGGEVEVDRGALADEDEEDGMDVEPMDVEL